MKKLFYISALFLLVSCKPSFQSEKEFYNWIGDEKNGLLKIKDMGGVVFHVKYLPPEYLVYNELKRKKKYSRSEKDSLLNLYKDSYSFLVTVEFKEKSFADNVLLSGLYSYGEYKERIELLNFSLDEYFHMKIKEENIPPVLWNLENTYTIGDKRNIYLVFGGNTFKEKIKETDKVDLFYNDHIFGTGLMHFVFNKKDIESIPEISFWKF